MFKTFAVILAATVIMAAGTPSFAAPVKADKKGILIASFGTSMPQAKRAIDNLVESTKKAFPGVEVRISYTSNIIRKKIAKEQKLIIPTPMEALAKMNDDGFTHVYVMPMHIIPGEEYEDIKSVTDAFASIKGKYGFRVLKLGTPFIAQVSDCDVMADVLINRFSAQLADKEAAIVLMGHGTPNNLANALYSQLQLSLNKKAEGRFFLGTVEAAPMIDDVIVALKQSSAKKLVLSPLMIVAGDHANNDLADAKDPESWISLLEKAGYKNISTHLVGLGEDPQMASLFVNEIKEMMK